MTPSWSKDAAIRRGHAIIDEITEETQMQGVIEMSITITYWDSEKGKFIPVKVFQNFQQKNNPYGEQNHPLKHGSVDDAV